MSTESTVSGQPIRATIDNVENHFRQQTIAKSDANVGVGCFFLMVLAIDLYRQASGEVGILGWVLESIPWVNRLPYGWVFGVTLVIDLLWAWLLLGWISRSPVENNFRRGLRQTWDALRLAATDLRSKAGREPTRDTNTPAPGPAGGAIGTVAKLLFAGVVSAAIMLSLADSLSLEKSLHSIEVPGWVGWLLVAALIVALAAVLLAAAEAARRDRYVLIGLITGVLFCFFNSFFTPTFTSAASRAACLTDSAFAVAATRALDMDTQLALSNLYGENWQARAPRSARATAQEDPCDGGALIEMDRAAELLAVDPDLTDLRFAEAFFFVLLLCWLISIGVRNQTDAIVIELTKSSRDDADQEGIVRLDPSDLLFRDPVHLKFDTAKLKVLAFDRPAGAGSFRPVNTVASSTRIRLDEREVILWNLHRLDASFSHEDTGLEFEYFLADVTYSGLQLPSQISRFGDAEFSDGDINDFLLLLPFGNENTNKVLRQQFERALRLTLIDLNTKFGSLKARLSQVARDDGAATFDFDYDLSSIAALDFDQRQIAVTIGRVARLNDFADEVGAAENAADVRCRLQGLEDRLTEPVNDALLANWERSMAEYYRSARGAGAKASEGLQTLWRIIGPMADVRLSPSDRLRKLKDDLHGHLATAQQSREVLSEAFRARLADAGRANEVTVGDQLALIGTMMANPQVRMKDLLVLLAGLSRETRSRNENIREEDVREIRDTDPEAPSTGQSKSDEDQGPPKPPPLDDED